MRSLLLLMSFSTMTVSSLSFPRKRLLSSLTSSNASSKKKLMLGTFSSSTTSATTSSPPEVFGASLSHSLLDQRPSHNNNIKLWMNNQNNVMPSSHVRYRYIDLPDNNTNNKNASSSWQLTVQKLSSMASILCVLDCTILPLITILFPLVKLPHALGHALALTLVVPIGSFTTLVNYYRHGRIRLLCTALVGLALVLLANAPSSLSLFLFTLSSQTTTAAAAATTATYTMMGSLLLNLTSHASSILSALHHGSLHKVTNLSGCALLMTSNYLSHQLVHKNCDC